MQHPLLLPKPFIQRHRRMCKLFKRQIHKMLVTHGRVSDLILLDRYITKLGALLHRNRYAAIRLKEGLEHLQSTSDLPSISSVTEPAIVILRDYLILTKNTGT